MGSTLYSVYRESLLINSEIFMSLKIFPGIKIFSCRLAYKTENYGVPPTTPRIKQFLDATL